MSPTTQAVIIEPIRRAFPAEKAKAWHYKIHPYYTKQPSNVVGEYIRHFCPQGGLVVDPFCGTGVTAIEALTSRRPTICVDLDPLAVFITRQTCLAPVDLNAYWEAYRQVEREMKHIMEFVRRASPKELEAYALKEWYPKGVRLPSNADRGCVEDLFTRANLIALAHLRASITKIPNSQARELLLFAFSGTLDKASILYRAAEPNKKHGGGSGLFMVYRYWVPPQLGQRDVWNAFTANVRRVAKAKGQSNALFGDFVRESETFKVYCDSAENLLKYLDENSVDYIYTDPPYGAHIAYLDLGTMWHAWLGFEVTDEMRAREAIEGGEQQFDTDHYLGVLQKSFEQMFYALKDDAWLSLVFHHKETRLWYAIRDMLRYTGFEYVNCVAQPLALPTFHKIKNPLRVLGESLIVNFQKTAKRRISEPIPLPMVGIIKNAAERAIFKGGGATTEEILREVVPELFEAGLMIDAASKNMGDILAILGDDFELGEDTLWHLRAGHKIGNFIPPRERIRYYVVSFLRKAGKANFDEITTTILPLLINGHKPTRDEISDVLEEVAVSPDGINWELKPAGEIAIQRVMPLFEEAAEYVTEIPASTTHNQHIYRLALLCQKAGLVPYIGRQERGDPMLARLKPLTQLNIKAEPEKMKRIEQIDIIWTTPDGSPIWAFEIEEHTPILSALERFSALLDAAPELGHRHQVTIVAPKTRRRKLTQELTSSSYIGRPQYLETKISYIFSEDLETAFNKFTTRASISGEELHSICHFPTTNEQRR